MGLRLNVANRQAVYFNHMKVTANVTNNMLRLSYRVGDDDRVTEPLKANDIVIICGVTVRVLGIMTTQVSRIEFAAPPPIVINKQKFYEAATTNSGGYVLQRAVYNHFYNVYGLTRPEIEELAKNGDYTQDANSAKAGEIITKPTGNVKPHKLVTFNGVIHDVELL
ncbi:hypothetical protein [Vibrio phage vB_VhaS-a]|nr:hypothetical protein [Vibrio phage vB_VhaS-a]